MNMEQTETQGINALLSRILAIVLWVVAVPMVLLVVLAISYLFALSGAFPTDSNATEKISALILSVWNAISPLGQSALQLVAPILVLLVVIVVIRLFIPRGENVERKTYDLPAILALVIVGTICVLPFAGQEIPETLKSVALVVVGFYFGKADKQ